MSIRERISGIWLISMTLLALLAYTVFFVAQMWLNILFALYLGLVILQGAALVIYQLGMAAAGAANPLGLVCAIAVLAVVCYMLFIKKYQEADELLVR